MEIDVLIFFIVIVILLIVIVVFQILKKLNFFQVINNAVSSTEQRLTDRVDKLTESMMEIKGKTEIFGDIGLKLSNILFSTGQRGKFGELLIENILNDVLPNDCWERQYPLSSGQVDIIIKTRDFIIPVDCKFPLSNYEKMMDAQDSKSCESLKKKFFSDVRARIDEASKYILPDEGTTNYSLMYVPAESIFLTILEDHDIIRYSMDNFVLICSPVTFFYIMHAINETIKREKLPEKIEEFYKNFIALKIEIAEFSDLFDTMLKHLRNVNNNKCIEASNQINKIKDHSDAIIL